MSEGLQAILNDDGVFEEYDDTYDLTIHCESAEEQEEVLNKLNWRWIPVSERLPEKNMECLVSVGDFNLTQTAMYSNLMRTLDHRIFYQGEYGEESFENITQYVKAWMPLPEPYKTESEK